MHTQTARTFGALEQGTHNDVVNKIVFKLHETLPRAAASHHPSHWTTITTLSTNLRNNLKERKR